MEVKWGSYKRKLNGANDSFAHVVDCRNKAIQQLNMTNVFETSTDVAGQHLPPHRHCFETV